MTTRDNLILVGILGLIWLGESLRLWTEYTGLNLVAGFVTLFLWNKVDTLAAKLLAAERQLAERRVTEITHLETSLIETQQRIERAQRQVLTIVLEHSEVLAALARGEQL